MPGKGYGVLSKVSKENWGGGGVLTQEKRDLSGKSWRRIPSWTRHTRSLSTFPILYGEPRSLEPFFTQSTLLLAVSETGTWGRRSLPFPTC